MNDNAAETVPGNLTGAITALVEQLRTGQAELLNRQAAAAYLGVGLTTFDGLNDRGLIPSPVHLGDSDRLPRWSRTEMRSWTIAGCPTRLKWQSMRASSLSNVQG